MRASRKHQAYGINLFFRDWYGRFRDADNFDHARNREDGKPVVGIEFGKYIAREQRRVDVANPIRPPAPGLVDREKLFNSSAVYCGRRDLFTVCLDANRKPRP